ncbi:hypothetical protein B2K_16240 [Paenibacillus mucilaginosus K02]|uniref:Uncharacterized protein n=1 Tax=Paenibacillus mucilaginosus K02 TaxID=997761 RepID=I0BIQ5_9BACL|nr:hypothetical protein B2K_16240 [Paenibacillus mucilaginosus K02]
MIISQGLVLQLVKVSELQDMAETIERQSEQIALLLRELEQLAVK